MLQNTINSWGFFLKFRSSDVYEQLGDIFRNHPFSPEDYLNNIFDVYSEGIELSYQDYLLSYLRRGHKKDEQNRTIEQIEDTVLLNIIHSVMKKCTEDERDLLLDLLAYDGGSVEKNTIYERLSIRAATMDRFLLPGIALVLINPWYYGHLDYMNWSFRINSQQYETLKSIQQRAPLGDEAAVVAILIAYHRTSIYWDSIRIEHDTVDQFSIPDDIFGNHEITSLPCIGIKPKTEFMEDWSRFDEFVSLLSQWSGHPTTENTKVILRVLTGYPFETSQEKIMWDGRQLRTLLYIVKYMFKASRGRGRTGKTYSVIIDNTVFDPEVERLDQEYFLDDPTQISNQIGNGKGVPLEKKKQLNRLYPSIYKLS